MRLALPTLVIVLFISVSLLWFLPCRPGVKIAAGLVLFSIGLKYLIYEFVGGSFIAPALPPILLLVMEILYSAMIILAFLLLIKDCLALFLWFSRILGSSWQLPLSPGIRAVSLVTAALALALYGTWQSLRVPEVRSVAVDLPGLPAALDGFSIVQLSDVHIGAFLKKKWLEKVVRRTNELQADLIVLTGDLIDGSPAALYDDIASLGELRARHGVYGVTGNHEYYFNARQWLAVFAELGIVMLENESRSFFRQGQELVLAGVPDQAARQFGEAGPHLEALAESFPGRIKVLLQHRPVMPLPGVADLQLSGHTHGGNIFFLKWLIQRFNGGLVGGLYDYGGGKIYVSPGTGIWSGFSCRLGVPSEITRLVLRGAQHG